MVHQYEKMFVPNFIVRLKGIKVAADLKETIAALLAFGLQVDYFNSDIFKWEPFLESSHLKLEYETLVDENGISGKNIRLLNPNKQFNVNISIPFIQKVLFLRNTSERLAQQKNEQLSTMTDDLLIRNLEKLLSESLLRKKGEKRLPEKRVFVSPVSVSNETGYDMEVTYYKKLVIVTEDNIPQMKNVYSKSVSVPNGQSAPLSIEEDSAKIGLDEEENKEVFSQTFEYKFLSFRILHPQLKLKKVSGLNLEQNFQKKVALEGDQKHVRHLSVLYHSQNSQEIKHIQISSSVVLENHLKKTVKIVIRQAEQRHPFEIGPGAKSFMRFDLLFFLTSFFIGDQEFDFKPKKLDHFLGKHTGYYFLLNNKDRSYNFVLKLVRDPEFDYLHRLLLLPAFGLKNLLPVPMRLTLLNPREERNFDLFRHQAIAVSDFDVSVKVSFKVKVQGFLWSEECVLVENLQLSYDKNVVLRDAEGNATNFSIIRLKKENKHFDFAIFCDMVLINECGLHLTYEYKSANERKKFIKVAGLSPLKSEEQEFDSNVVFLGSEKTQLALSLVRDKIFFSTQQSTTLMTQGIGSGVVHEPIKKREDDKIRDFFLEIGYKSYVYGLDEEEYISSKIIQLIPKTILCNKTSYDISLLSESQIHDSTLSPEEK